MASYDKKMEKSIFYLSPQNSDFVSFNVTFVLNTPKHFVWYLLVPSLANFHFSTFIRDRDRAFGNLMNTWTQMSQNPNLFFSVVFQV